MALYTYTPYTYTFTIMTRQPHYPENAKLLMLGCAGLLITLIIILFS